MQVRNPLFAKIHFDINLFRRLLNIQTVDPTPDEMKAIYEALSTLGITQEAIQDDSLETIRRHLLSLVDELYGEIGEIMMMSAKVPSSVETTLLEFIDVLKGKDQRLQTYFEDSGLKEGELRLLLEPKDDDTLIDSEAYSELKEIYDVLLVEAENLVKTDLKTDADLDDLLNAFKDIEFVDFILRFFDLVDYKEDTPVEQTYGALVSKINNETDFAVNAIDGLEQLFQRARGFALNESIVGNEALAQGIIACTYPEFFRVTGQEANFLESLKNGVSKVVESVGNALKSLWDYFKSGKKDTAEHMAQVQSDFKEQLEKMEAIDPAKLELDQDNLQRTVDMLDKANLPEVANYFKNLQDPKAVITAYQKAVDDLAKRVGDASAAQKEMDNAQKALDDLKSSQPEVSQDASPDEKKTVKADFNEKMANAKASLTSARDKVIAFFAPTAAVDRLKATMGKVVKLKPKEPEAGKVQGTESLPAWML